VTHPQSPATFDAVADDAWPLVLSRDELRLLAKALDVTGYLYVSWLNSDNQRIIDGSSRLHARIAQRLADVEQATSASGCALGWRQTGGKP
jgi:hypothetical protein